ncbi:MAG: hypothetical protein GEV05_14730 [Betaproteobacteria bacterium]|nr:hypothetical protein [Betaproteobacteria bacterium]
MELARALKHLLILDRMALRPFPRAALDRIEHAIGVSERSHGGELRLVLEANMSPLEVLRGRSARDRALELFSLLRVWDTEHNSGVLIYLQMVDHRIEIVADRGISRLVAQSEWDAICRRMESAFRGGVFEAGTVEAIGEVTQLLNRHFPPGEHNPDELPDRPVIIV